MFTAVNHELSPFAPRKIRSFAERKATLVCVAILIQGNAASTAKTGTVPVRVYKLMVPTRA